MKAHELNMDYLLTKDNKQLNGIPGDYGLPVIGNTFGFVATPFKVLDEVYRKYGAVSKMSLTMQRVVMMLGPEYNKLMTLDREQAFSSRMGYDDVMGDFFAGGLLMRDFSDHKMHRRIMQTAFKTDAMRGYVGTMQPIIDTTLRDWGSADDFCYYPNVKKLLLDIGAQVFLGLELRGKETDEMNRAFLQMVAGGMAFIRKDWPGTLYRRALVSRHWLEEYFMQLVAQRRIGSGGKDMASYFSRERTEDGEYFEVREVAEHLIFLLLAAHDTTTSALTMASYLLAQDQTAQQRAREEALALGKEQLEYDDLDGNVDFIDRIFKETLRLHPPVPNIMRRTVKDIEVDGFHIPAHTMVHTAPLYVHRMSEWWSDPHGFDPDRFAPGREEHKRHTFLWAPFGGGAHKCIGLHFAGMLFKCIMFNMLRQYRFRFPDGYQYPAKIQDFPFAKTRDDLPLILEPLQGGSR